MRLVTLVTRLLVMLDVTYVKANIERIETDTRETDMNQYIYENRSSPTCELSQCNSWNDVLSIHSMRSLAGSLNDTVIL